MVGAKLIYLAKRNPLLSRDSFPDRWRQHSAMPRKDPNRVLEVSGVTYSLIESVAAGVAAEDYDAIGMVELTGLQSIPAAARALSVRGEIAADELVTFSRHVECCALFCSVDVLHGGPVGQVGLIQFVRRAADIRPTPFVRGWRAAGLARLKAAGLTVNALIQNVVVAPPPADYRYDGVQELWFDSQEIALAAAQTLADDPSLIDMSASPTFLTTTIMRRASTPVA